MRATEFINSYTKHELILERIIASNMSLEEGILDKIVNLGVLSIIGLSAYAGLSLKDILTKPEIPIEKRVYIAKQEGVQLPPVSAVKKDNTDQTDVQNITKPIDQKVPKIRAITGTALEDYLKYKAEKNNITGVELASFLAQCAHETNDYRNLVEVGDNNRWLSYERKKSLGNTQKGDGFRYRGRGYIQLTGRYNYRIAGQELGIPLEKQPELAADPEVAAKIAIWFWKKRVQPNVTNYKDIKSVTYPINPGLHGLESRTNKFNMYMRSAKI